MAFKMKNSALKAQAAMAGCPRTAAKMKAESAMKMKKSAMEMKSPMEKELVGKQHNLPEELKAKIEAAPSKMRSRKGAMDTESPMKLSRDRKDGARGEGKGYKPGPKNPMKPGDLTPREKREREANRLRDTYKPNKEIGSGKGLKPFDPSDPKARKPLKKSPAPLLGKKKKKSEEAPVSRSVTKTSGYGLQPTVTQTSSTKKDGKFVRTTTNTADNPLAKEKHEYLKKEGKFPSEQAERDHAKKNKVYSSTITKQATKKGKKTFTAADGNPKYMTKTKTKRDGTVKTKQKRYRKNIFKGQPGVRPL